MCHFINKNQPHYIISLAIENYLSTNDDLAMQIDGDWGTGKTYYVKNYVFNYMRRGMYNNNTYMPIYVSLNGINDISKLKSKINTALIVHGVHNSKKKSVLMALNLVNNGLNGLFNSNKYLKVLKNFGVTPKSITHILDNFTFEAKNNIVLIFDDLERMDMKLSELFGFISNIQDQFNCKIIIISNEKAIIRTESKRKFFNDNKEKIINKTVHFGNDSKVIAVNILKNNISPEDYLRSWIINVSKNIINNLTTVNIRILLSIIINYKIFYKRIIKLSGLRLNLQEKALKAGYLSIFTLTDLLKKDKIVDHRLMNKIFNVRYSGLTNIINNNKIFTNNYLYKEFFENSNKSFQDNILYTTFILHLVKSDEFNDTDAKKYVIKISKIFFNSLIMIKESVAKLSNYHKLLPDAELKKYEKRLDYAINTTYWGKIPINCWISVYSLICKLNRNRCMLYPSLLNDISKNDIVYMAKKLPMNKICDISPAAIVHVNKGLKQDLNRVYNNKRLNIPKYYTEQIILNNIKLIPNNMNWLRYKSIFKIILENKDIQHILLDTQYPVRVINLSNYINNVMLKSYEKEHIYSPLELKYEDRFLSFIKEAISNNNSINYPVTSHSLNVALVYLSKIVKNYCKYINKKN